MIEVTKFLTFETNKKRQKQENKKKTQILTIFFTYLNIMETVFTILSLYLSVFLSHWHVIK